NVTRCVADGDSPKKRSSSSWTPGPRRSKSGPSTPTLSSKCSVYEPGGIAAPAPEVEPTGVPSSNPTLIVWLSWNTTQSSNGVAAPAPPAASEPASAAAATSAPHALLNLQLGRDTGLTSDSPVRPRRSYAAFGHSRNAPSTIAACLTAGSCTRPTTAT